MKRGGYIEAMDGAAVVAQGTADSPITFDSAEADPLPGDWECIAIDSGSIDSALINTKPAKDIGQRVRQGCANADEETLHGEPSGALIDVELICYERAKGLHAYINVGIQNPEQSGGHP